MFEKGLALLLAVPEIFQKHEANNNVLEVCVVSTRLKFISYSKRRDNQDKIVEIGILRISIAKIIKIK